MDNQTVVEGAMSTFDDYLKIEGQLRPDEVLSRCRLLLLVLHNANCLDKRVTDCYFHQLSQLFGRRQRLNERGKIIIGLSPGRSASTSLTGILRSIPGCLSTHENPLSFDDDDQWDRYQFHIKRFQFLRQYVPLIFDIAPHWIHYVGRLSVQFNDSLFIHLKRPTAAIVQSYQKVQFRRYEMRVDEYVDNYQMRAALFAGQMGNRMTTVAVDQLDDSTLQQNLFKFLGKQGKHTILHHNQGQQREGSMYWF